MGENTLYEIRCPNNAWKGNSHNLHCRTLCGKVNALTVGEFSCRKCKIIYNFAVNEDGTVDYFYEPTPADAIKKRHGGKTAEEKLLELLEEQGIEP